MKMRDQVARHEIAGYENAGHEIATHFNVRQGHYVMPSICLFVS